MDVVPELPNLSQASLFRAVSGQIDMLGCHEGDEINITPRPRGCKESNCADSSNECARIPMRPHVKCHLEFPFCQPRAPIRDRFGVPTWVQKTSWCPHRKRFHS